MSNQESKANKVPVPNDVVHRHEFTMILNSRPVNHFPNAVCYYNSCCLEFTS